MSPQNKVNFQKQCTLNEKDEEILHHCIKSNFRPIYAMCFVNTIIAIII